MFPWRSPTEPGARPTSPTAPALGGNATVATKSRRLTEEQSAPKIPSREGIKINRNYLSLALSLSKRTRPPQGSCSRAAGRGARTTKPSSNRRTARWSGASSATAAWRAWRPLRRCPGSTRRRGCTSTSSNHRSSWHPSGVTVHASASATTHRRLRASRLLADPRTSAAVCERVAELSTSLDPIRLLRQMRVHQQRVVDIADQPVAEPKDTAVPPLEQFLAGLRTAWAEGEARPTAKPAAKPKRERRRPGSVGQGSRNSCTHGSKPSRGAPAASCSSGSSGASGRVPGRPPAHGAAAGEGLAQGEGDSDGCSASCRPWSPSPT